MKTSSSSERLTEELDEEEGGGHLTSSTPEKVAAAATATAKSVAEVFRELKCSCGPSSCSCKEWSWMNCGLKLTCAVTIIAATVLINQMANLLTHQEQ